MRKFILVIMIFSLLLSPAFVLAASSSGIGASLTIIETGSSTPEEIIESRVSGTPFFIFEDKDEKDEGDSEKDDDIIKDDESQGEDIVIDEEDINNKEDEIIKMINLVINNIEIVKSGNVIPGTEAMVQNGQLGLSGQTDQGLAYVFIKVRGPFNIDAMIETGSDGTWNWQAPLILSSGNYQLYFSVNKNKNEPIVSSYYIINFQVPAQELVNEEEKEKIIIDQEKKPIIEKIIPSKAREVKSVVVGTVFEITNEITEVSPHEFLSYNFDARTIVSENFPNEVIIRLRDMTGRILQEKSYVISVIEDLLINDEFLISEDYEMGTYYLESVMKINENYIADRLGFNVVLKKNFPIIGTIKIKTKKELMVLYSIELALAMFVGILLYQIFIIGKLSDIAEVGGMDLKKQIKSLNKK